MLIKNIQYFFIFQYFVYQSLESDYEKVMFENIHFRKQFVVSKITETVLHLMFQRYSGEFEIYANKELLLTGRVTVPEDPNSLQYIEKIDVNEDYIELQENDIYDELNHRGCMYTGSYKIVKSVKITDQGNADCFSV